MTESETPNFTDKTDSVLACQHLQKIYDQGPQQIKVLKARNEKLHSQLREIERESRSRLEQINVLSDQLRSIQE